MKKIFTLISGAILLSGISFGQAQRLVLAEEFTGETCGPCAAYNPAFNVTLDANASKIVSIKYQNNIPSTGPNFYLYNTADIANRTTFYANNYSPHGFLDGNVWEGNVASFPVATMNSRYAVASPFEVEVTHSFSPAHDIIYTHTVVRAVQAVSSANALNLRVAITEKNVYGYTSPNGESTYEHVMRKMLPTGTGTALPTTWNVGDSVVTDLQWTIAAGTPPNIYYPFWPMLEVVSFVQADVTKEVMQVGKSYADPAAIVDAAITSTTVPSFLCTSNFTPSVTLKNYEGYTVTSMDIEYGITGQGLSTYTWNGSLAAGATANVTLPVVTSSGTGIFTFVANILTINGSSAPVNINNNKSIQMGVPASGVTTITQAFAPTTFPPVNWILENPDNGATWSRSSAGLNGAGSAKMDFYNSTASNIDILDIVEPLDLTSASSANLTFDVAYKQYSAAENDNLKVEISTDCGQTWTAIYNKSGATLSTSAGYQTTGFTPTSTAMWRNEVVSLANYIGQNGLLLRYKATSAYGNNAYVDNVNVTVVTGVNEILNDNSVSVYPGLVQDKLNVNVNFTEVQNLTIAVTDVLGKQVNYLTVVNAKNNSYVIDMSNVSSGTYFVTLSADKGKSFTKKVSKY